MLLKLITSVRKLSIELMKQLAGAIYFMVFANTRNQGLKTSELYMIINVPKKACSCIHLQTSQFNSAANLTASNWNGSSRILLCQSNTENNHDHARLEEQW